MVPSVKVNTKGDLLINLDYRLTGLMIWSLASERPMFRRQDRRATEHIKVE